jgi:aminoglycoside 6'-N-acetyltransferase I
MGKISTAGVLRLRATSAVSRDTARRSAQDDDFVGVLTKNILDKLALMEIRVRPGEPLDREQLLLMRLALWPELSVDEDRLELDAALSGKPMGTMPLTILVAETGDGDLVGFLEVGLRSHADGCDTRVPVGFVEGWSVSELHRRKGVGAKLLAAAEDWARGHGCIEMASDTWLENDKSQRVHEALGFEVVDRCVHYRKPL